MFSFWVGESLVEPLLAVLAVARFSERLQMPRLERIASHWSDDAGDGVAKSGVLLRFKSGNGSRPNWPDICHTRTHGQSPAVNPPGQVKAVLCPVKLVSIRLILLFEVAVG